MKVFLRLAAFMLLCATFSLFTASCKSDPSENSDETVYKGGIVAFYPPNGLGDNSAVDAFCSGIQKTGIQKSLWVYDVCPTNWTDAKKLLDDYIPRCFNLSKEQGTSILIVLADPGYLSYLSGFTATKPEKVSFLLFDAKKESEDAALNTVYVPLYGASYLAGVAAKALLAEKEDSHVLSLLANSDSAVINDALQGFIAGYGADWDKQIYGSDFTEWSDEKASAFSKLSFAALELKNDLDTSGFDSAEFAYALALFAEKWNPFDLYFPLCGGSIQGLLRYNREKRANSFYTVGMDSDLSVYTQQVPFSVVKHIDRVIQKCVEQWMGGTFPHHQTFTLADGYTELVISKKYTEKLSDLVQNATQTAIEKERIYEEN